MDSKLVTAYVEREYYALLLANPLTSRMKEKKRLQQRVQLTVCSKRKTDEGLIGRVAASTLEEEAIRIAQVIRDTYAGKRHLARVSKKHSTCLRKIQSTAIHFGPQPRTHRH